MEMSLSKEGREWIDGLRELADFAETHPTVFDFYGETFNQFPCDAAALATIAHEIGTCEKVQLDPWYILSKQFGPHSLEFNTQREKVCTKVVVGTKIVSKPDPNAPKIEVEEEVCEWQCPDSILEFGKPQND